MGIAELVSYGDCIEPGIYMTHSLFSNVGNYVQDEKLIALVTGEVGKGPNNIVVNHIDFKKVEWIRIDEETLNIGSIAFNRTLNKKYCSKIDAFPGREPNLRKNLEVFKKIVKTKASQKSLAFLLNETKQYPSISAFESASIKRIKAGWEELMKNDYEEGTRLLIGTGYGLTPAGDDFIAGYLTGLYVAQEFMAKDVLTIRQSIYRTIESTNIISQTIITFAWRGYFYEKTKNLLLSLIYGDGPDITEPAMAMLSLGETSGADFATGLLCALKNQ